VGHAEKLLGDVLHLRGVLKKKITSQQPKGRVWVADTCGMIDRPGDKAVPERVKALRGVTAKDGVHFSDEGYSMLAKNTVETVLDLAKGNIGNTLAGSKGTAGPSVSDPARRFNWHGFSSPVGSSRPEAPRTWKRPDRERFIKRFAPYGGRGGGGGFSS